MNCESPPDALTKARNKHRYWFIVAGLVEKVVWQIGRQIWPRGAIIAGHKRR
jgi:hypothetical protein